MKSNKKLNSSLKLFESETSRSALYSLFTPSDYPFEAIQISIVKR